MGGFVFDTDDVDEEQYIPRSPRLTVTPRGMKFLADIGHIPDIAKDAISDKSKADLLAKSLVCLQAGWMIVQCITRKASGLPLTFLEINTLGHVICALLMYYLWLDKPLDIRDPTPITGPWKRPLCAIMFMSSKASQKLSQKQIRGSKPLGEMAILRFYKNQALVSDPSHSDGPPTTADMITRLESSHDQIRSRTSDARRSDSEESISGLKNNSVAAENQDGTTQDMTDDVMETLNNQRYRAVPITNYSDAADSKELSTSANTSISCIDLLPSDSTVVTIRKSQTLAGTGIGPSTLRITSLSHYIPITQLDSMVGKNVPIPDSAISKNGFVSVKPTPVIHLDRVDVARWELSSKALKVYPAALALKEDHLYYSASYVSLRMKNLRDDGLLRDFSIKPFVVLSFATIAYGGLHLAAWNAFFPSYAEHLMWKISGLIVMGSGFVWGIVVPLEERYDMIDTFGETAFSFIFAIILITYVAARMFLVVEAFISIRKLPVEVYELPQWSVWTQFIPHL